MKNMEGCMNELEKFKNELSLEAHGITKAEAHSKGVCINCKEPAEPKCYSVAGRREYLISGMCEVCFDSLFKEEE
jgi:hypothetical protein